MLACMLCCGQLLCMLLASFVAGFCWVLPLSAFSRLLQLMHATVVLCIGNDFYCVSEHTEQQHSRG